jgi:uncharacterized membrane protein YdfJ with MMPL/SSD domain
MGNESAYFPPFLIIAGLLTITLIASYFWRKSSIFNQQNQWSSASSCALLWAGTALIFSVSYMTISGDFGSLLKAFQVGIFESFRIGMVGIDELFALIIVPFVAVLGALFGASFSWLKHINKASGSLLQRGLIGAGIGFVLPIILSILGLLIFMANNHVSLQELMQTEYGVIILFIWGIILATITIVCLILALITPRHLLTNTNELN